MYSAWASFPYVDFGTAHAIYRDFWSSNTWKFSAEKF